MCSPGPFPHGFRRRAYADFGDSVILRRLRLASTLEIGQDRRACLSPADHPVNVAFDYQFKPSGGDVAGTSRLVAVFASNNGWRWNFELQGESSFAAAPNSAACSTCPGFRPRWTAGAAGRGEAVGIHARPRALHCHQRHAFWSGTARSLFAALVFSLNELQMHLAAPSSRGGENPDPFLSGESKSLRKPREAPNTIMLLGLSLDVSATRTLSLIGLALSLLGAGVLTRWLPDEVRLTPRKRASGLATALCWFEVRDGSLSVSRNLVEVASIDDLAKVAERNSRMILHQAHAGEQAYFVQEDDVTYCYRSGSGATPTAVAARVVPAGEGGR